MTEILKIYKNTDPELRVVCKPVEKFDDRLEQTALNMWATMMLNHGCGLAANQVGLDIKLICVKGKAFQGYMINPTWSGNETKIEFPEGCLSLPGKSVKKSRYESVVVNYFDIDGKEHTIALMGLDAVIVQHECDHLDGVLMTDKEY